MGETGVVSLPTPWLLSASMGLQSASSCELRFRRATREPAARFGCCNVVLPVAGRSSIGEMGLNRLRQPRGDPNHDSTQIPSGHKY
jgi:hypothetical protein